MSQEFVNFTNVLDRVLSVSKDEPLKREATYKAKADMNPRIGDGFRLAG